VHIILIVGAVGYSQNFEIESLYDFSHAVESSEDGRPNDNNDAA